MCVSGVVSLSGALSFPLFVVGYDFLNSTLRLSDDDDMTTWGDGGGRATF
jgi:hypothetical protein